MHLFSKKTFRHFAKGNGQTMSSSTCLCGCLTKEKRKRGLKNPGLIFAVCISSRFCIHLTKVSICANLQKTNWARMLTFFLSTSCSFPSTSPTIGFALQSASLTKKLHAAMATDKSTDARTSCHQFADFWLMSTSHRRENLCQVHGDCNSRTHKQHLNKLTVMTAVHTQSCALIVHHLATSLTFITNTSSITGTAQL